MRDRIINITPYPRFKFSLHFLYIQIETVIIEDKTLPPENFEDLALAIGRAKCSAVRLHNSDLTVKKLHAFGEGCQKNEIRV